MSFFDKLQEAAAAAAGKAKEVAETAKQDARVQAAQDKVKGFADSVKANPKVQAAQDKVSSFAETQKLNAKIKSAEETMKDAYAKIGQKFFEAHMDDAGEEFMDDFLVVKTSKDLIEAAKLQIENLKKKAESAEEPAEAPAEECCEAPAEECCEAPAEAPAEEPSVVKVCPECGAEVQADDTFCVSCGAKLI